MNSKNDYHKLNGKRELAARIAQEVTGMMLAQAYMTIKSAGYNIKINKFDGVVRLTTNKDDSQIIYVDVDDGFIKKSWAS